MVNAFLIHDGGGRFHAASKIDHHNIMQRFPVGDRVRAKLTAPRSLKQNNWFHCIVQTAFNNQQGGPEFADWKALRSYLLIQAGWFDEWSAPWVVVGGRKAYKFNIMRPVIEALAAGMRRRADYTVVIADTKRELIVFRVARSFSFESCPDPEEATRIIDHAIGTICQEIIPGVSEEELRTMSKNAPPIDE